MASIVSAVLGDLISRSISFAVDRCCDRRREGILPDKLQRLRRVLLRIQTTVEEAERRRVTNQAMLRQLQLMREGMYRGYYLLNAIARHADMARDREVSHHHRRHPSFALSEFGPAKRLCTLPASSRAATATGPGAEAAELQQVLVYLERMASDMKELVLLLSCYPPLPREAYIVSSHQWLEHRMFGREAELERIVSFLLQPEPPGTEDLGVLPMVGRASIGKSTLVEHVCYDERVRSHFSMIVFFSKGNAMDENLHLMPLGYSGVMRHRNNDLASTGRSLVVIELLGDVDESTWRRTLSTLKGERVGMAPVGKIVVTSRSEKIAGFGTRKALELEPLPQEAYWYFFKTMALGSADAEEQPELASVCMEIAELMNRSFLFANVIAGMLRGNLRAPFWHKVLKRIKDHTSMHLRLFGEHPVDLMEKDRPIYLWSVPKTDSTVIAYSCYQECSAQQQDLPRITAQDLHVGSGATPQGKFEILSWRSRIPPYYSYVLRCRVPRNKHTRQRRIPMRISASDSAIIATTDEYGNFSIDLPSGLHATPDLEKACAVRVLRLPADTSCRLRHRPGAAYGLRLLLSEGDGARAYTAGVIKLQSGDTPPDECVGVESVAAERR